MTKTMMRNKDLYEKTCKTCGLIFRTDKKNAYICRSCLKKKNEQTKSYRSEIRKKEKEKKPPTLSILEMSRLVTKYNLEHGTNYTYGKFEEALQSGKIKI